MPITSLPPFIQANYEIHEWRHAAAVLKEDFPQEWDEVCSVLSGFRLFRSEVIAPGGGRSRISARIDGVFRDTYGWKEQDFNTTVTVNGNVLQSKSHKVDNFKHEIACDVEWNNKTEFYDRDLGNFATLHALSAISVGIIVTRATELDDVFATLGNEPTTGRPYKDKYGASTTHMDKLVPKVNAGEAGGCPVVVFGIRKSLYVDDLANPAQYVPHPDAAKHVAQAAKKAAKAAKAQGGTNGTP